MALPVTGTVTAKWKDWRDRAGGEPIKLIPTAALVYHPPSDYAYHNVAIVLSPDSEGTATATVLPTNSADLTPSGWGYEVVFPRTWNVPSKVIQVPIGATVDIFAAAGIIPETDVQVGVVLSVNDIEPDETGNVVLDVGGDFVTPAELETALSPIEADLDTLTGTVAAASSAASAAQATATAASDLAEQTAADLAELIPDVPDRVKVRQQYITDGSGASIPATGANWAAVGGFEISIPAVVGDHVRVNVSGLRSETSNLFTDIAVISGTTLVRFLATGTSTPAPEGDPGFYIAGNLPAAGGSRGLTVTSGDLDGGSLRVVLAARGQGAGRVYADSTYPWYWSLENLGPVD